MKRAFQYVTHYGSANQEFADASVRRYEQKGVLRAGVPSPSPQSPSPFSLPPYPLSPIPYPFRRLLRRLAITRPERPKPGQKGQKETNGQFLVMSLFSQTIISRVFQLILVPYQIQHSFECIFKLFLKTVLTCFVK